MFDLELLKRDDFIDLPAEAKALYFILGIEADDEGFVNPKIPMRVHMFANDSLKLLIAKQLLIPFKSGVVVITDWKINNWLDNRRIRPTIFAEEKKTLVLRDNRYVLSARLANAPQMLRENRIEENRIEENSIDISDFDKSDSPKKEKGYKTLRSFETGKPDIVEKAKKLYPDKLVEKAFDNFVEQNKIKNYKYRDFYLAFCKWVREDRFGHYTHNPF